MIRFLLLATLTLAVIVFQNCSNKKIIPISLSAKDSKLLKSVTEKPLALSLDLRTAISLQINNVKNTEAITPRDSLVKSEIYYYLVNLSDGKIQSFDLNKYRLKSSFCLTESDRLELANILDTAQICESRAQSEITQGETVCSMNYVMPYAKLHFPRRVSYALGEKNNGCDIPTDLCGDHSALLRGYVRKILLNIKTKVCNLQSSEAAKKF